MKLSPALRQKASASLLRELGAGGSDSLFTVVVKLRREPGQTAGKASGPSRARLLRKSVKVAGKRAMSLIEGYKKRNPFIYFRPSFLLHGLIVSAPLEVVEKIASLDEVVSVEENRKLSLPTPLWHRARLS